MITIEWPFLVILFVQAVVFSLVIWVLISLNDEPRYDSITHYADGWDDGYEAAINEAIATLNEYPEKYEDSYEYHKSYVQAYEDVMALKERREYDK